LSRNWVVLSLQGPGALPSPVNITLPSTLKQRDKPDHSSLRNAWFTLSFKNDARIIDYAVDRFDELVEDLKGNLPAESGWHTVCMFQPLTEAIVRAGAERGGNVMGLDEYVEAHGNGVMFLILAGLHGEREEREILRPKMKAYLDDVDAYARSIGVAWDWLYVNYADRLQDPMKTLGEKALAKMRAASAKYDPDGVFQKLRQTGFRLPRT